ncbi:hypothetical protein KA107_00650 [Candidatus Pacearchaeota archaeon]|nr:hypothetical protein [Candidatus Pacearchaeota archaeon]
MAKRNYTPHQVASYIYQYVKVQKLADSLVCLKSSPYKTSLVDHSIRTHAQILRSTIEFIEKEVPSEVRKLVNTNPSLSSLESLATNTLLEIGAEKSSDKET